MQSGNADSPSMTASTAPPAQNSMRIYQQQGEKGNRVKVFSTFATQVFVYVKQHATRVAMLGDFHSTRATSGYITVYGVTELLVTITLKR